MATQWQKCCLFLLTFVLIIKYLNTGEVLGMVLLDSELHLCVFSYFVLYSFQ